MTLKNILFKKIDKATGYSGTLSALGYTIAVSEKTAPTEREIT
jgi:hypothetical protein